MKGDIARAIFYMDVRYEGDRLNEPDLILIDNPGRIPGNTNTYMGRSSALLKGHRADPVDGAEQQRSDLIFERYQHNRNPFVDHPEWIEAVFAPALSASSKTAGSLNSQIAQLQKARVCASVVHQLWLKLYRPWD
jgi:hypothetical protein